MAGKLGKIAKNCVEVTKVILLDQSIAGHGVKIQFFGLLGGSFQSPPPPPLTSGNPGTKIQLNLSWQFSFLNHIFPKKVIIGGKLEKRTSPVNSAYSN